MRWRPYALADQYAELDLAIVDHKIDCYWNHHRALHEAEEGEESDVGVGNRNGRDRGWY